MGAMSRIATLPLSLLLFSALVVRPSAAEDPVAQLVDAWQAGVGELTAAYLDLAGRASDAYAAIATAADAEAVGDLVRSARKLARDGDAEAVGEAWLEVLRIDIQQVEARAYFESLGKLEDALDQALGAPGAGATGSADLLGGGTATPDQRQVPEAFAEIIAEREAALADALEDFHAGEAKARERFAKYEERLREKVVRKLASIAKSADRKGVLAVANEAWRAVLRLDRDHEEAIAAFTRQGALDQVLTELGDEITVESLLGPVPEPSGGYFGLKGEGRRIVLVKRGDEPLQDAIAAHLEELGFEVDTTGVGDGGWGEDTALILAVQTSDATYGKVSHAADYEDIPVVVVHPKLLLAARLVPGNAQYPHRTVTRTATITDPAHPMAARMKGEVEILTPAAEQRDTVVELSAYERDQDLGAAAQVVVTMDGVPAIVAWEGGSPFADPADKHEKLKERIDQTANVGRVVGCFLLTGADPALLTPDAWRLFDAGVAWALARCSDRGRPTLGAGSCHAGAGTAARGGVAVGIELIHDPLAAILESDPEGESGHRVAEALLRSAVYHGATDIHLDPEADGIVIRLRCDGLLREAARLAWTDAPRLINQLKVLGGVDPMTVFHPEDARWSQEIEGRTVNLRLTIAPCLRGPKLAIRVLDRSQAELDLVELGIAEEDFHRVEDWLAGASGMVVCAGPTGAGKTTTLYALLRALVADDRHIAAIEDPPEYTLDGVNQVAVDERHGIDFATGLHALLRMDADYLMLGEVRDPETAHVLVDAANSGRVALTSLHSRDAVGVVTQLRNWAIEDPVISATTSLVVAQRLVGRLCPRCRRPAPPDAGQERWLEARSLAVPGGAHVADGCDHCAGTGYRGRQGIFELWSPTPSELAMIRDGADESALRRQLAHRGHRDLAGTIGLEDLRRAAIPITAGARATGDRSGR